MLNYDSTRQMKICEYPISGWLSCNYDSFQIMEVVFIQKKDMIVMVSVIMLH